MSSQFSIRLSIFLIMYLILTLEGIYLPFLYAIGFTTGIVKGILFLKYIIIFFIAVAGAKVLQFQKYETTILGVMILLVCFLFFQFVRFNAFELTLITTQLYPFLIFFAGRKINVTSKQMFAILKILCIGSVVLSVYAIIDVLVIPATLWSDVLDQGRYLIDVKNSDPDVIWYNVTGNFYYDPFNLMIRRAIGTQGDPLAFAYSLILPFFLLFFERKNFGKWGWIFIIIIASALWLSYTRAAIISIILITLSHLVFKKRQIYVTMIIGVIIMFTIAIFGDQLLKITGASDSSSFGHVESLSSIFNRNISSFFLGGILSGESQIHRYESGFLNIFVNYGLLVVFLFYFSISKIISKLYEINTNLSISLALTGSAGAFTSIIFSESFFTFTGFGMFWFLSGIVISNYYFTMLTNKMKDDMYLNRVLQ
jgi:hypothetical protein